MNLNFAHKNLISTSIFSIQDPLNGANITTNQMSSSSGLPSSLAIIGAHHEHDKEFTEIGENISSFRTNSSLFSNQSRINKPIESNASEMYYDEEEGKSFRIQTLPVNLSFLNKILFYLYAVTNYETFYLQMI